jgi:hypothetical protein
MGGSAKESQLGASLAAEVLRDQRQWLSSWKSQAKMDYLETQKKLLLVSKIVDKNKSLSSGGGSESEDGGGTKHKTTGTALFADLGCL